jgi:hypothetical protein
MSLFLNAVADVLDAGAIVESKSGELKELNAISILMEQNATPNARQLKSRSSVV